MGILKLALGNKRRLLCCFSILLFSFLLYWHKDFLHVGLQTYLMKYSIVEERDLFDRRPRVLCMIMTTISNWKTKGKAVRNTWAKRCHRAILFYTKVGDWTASSITKEPNATGLDVPDGRRHLTAKTFAALNYSYLNYASEVDFFLKADDDTYIIMENLQRIISKFNSSPRLYLGRRFGKVLHKRFNSGGAGYVLGKAAVKLMLEGRSSFPEDCPEDGGKEDVHIGRCLTKFGIYTAYDLDDTGRQIFHSDNPLQVLRDKPIVAAYYAENKEKMHSREDFMLSQWTATMHNITAAQMYMFDFLLYGLRRESLDCDRS